LGKSRKKLSVKLLPDHSCLFSELGKFDNRTINISLKKKWLKELKILKLIPEDTVEDDIITDIKQVKEMFEQVFFLKLKADLERKFIRQNGIWSEACSGEGL